MKRYLTILLSFLTFGAVAQNSTSQNEVMFECCCSPEQPCCAVTDLTIKTNLLYDATATINLGVEFALGRNTTLDISGNYNAWYTDKSKNYKIRHSLIQPEFRYYFDERFKGHYVGVHLLAGEYNVNGGNWLFGTMISMRTISDLEEGRYQGVGYGVGATYGYVTPIANRLDLEFNIGVGYIFLDYDRYGSRKCAPFIESDSDGYIGLTKLGVTLSYTIKQRNRY